MTKSPASLFLKEPSRAKEARITLDLTGEALKKIKTAMVLGFALTGGDMVVLTDLEGKKISEMPTDLAAKIRIALRAQETVEAVVIERNKNIIDVLIKSSMPIFKEEEELTEDIKFGLSGAAEEGEEDADKDDADLTETDETEEDDTPVKE